MNAATITPPGPAELASLKRDRAVLFTLQGSQLGSVFTLATPSTLIGRESGVDVRLDDATVSGQHARLLVHGHGASIEDLGSRNGTFVNERRVEGRALLADGDHVRLGIATIVKFSMLDELEEHALSTLFALALRDPLTRLFNRRYFDDRLLGEFSFARRQGTLLTLLLIDVDHFKALNDTHGHHVGDAVLKVVSASLERMMRPEDVLARFGGDEFVVIARDTSLRNVEILAERICHRVHDMTLELPKLDLGVTVSAGVATMGPEAAVASVERLIAAADHALCRAKVSGRNRVVGCSLS